MVLNPEAVQRFFYWVNERHSIYLKKESGAAWPWTEDLILQKYKFTNPFRENDRDTKWMRKHWDRPDAPYEEQLFNVCFFRMFGGVEFLRLHGWVQNWDTWKTKMLARDMINRGEKVFTGAYIITNQGLRLPKEQVVVDYFLTPIWDNRFEIARAVAKGNSLEEAHKTLSQFQGWGGGGFMAYEAVTDFNYTILPVPNDRYLWANAGPGAKRGLNRLHDRPLEGGGKRNWNEEMQELLSMSGRHLKPHIMHDHETLPMVDMRMIEHSLCEWDKYERVRLGQGTPRSLYKPRKP